MTRLARVVVVGVPHHITQRGNNRQNIFLNDTDRSKYLAWINEYSRRYNTEILAYCLMNNHVHFIAIPQDSRSLAKTFNNAHTRYSRYYNHKTGACGHLWQGRFYSCALDEKHLYRAIRYVERNPVRAKLAINPWDWKWSSAAFHTGRAEGTPSLCYPINMLTGIDDWEEYLRQTDECAELDLIRKQTKTGRPIGGDEFVHTIESTLNRTVRVKKAGRPKKN